MAHTAPTVPSALPPLSTSVHPLLDVQMSGTLWHPIVLGKRSLVQLQMFYWLEIEAGRQSNTVGRLWFFSGGDAREYPGGLLRLDPAFAYAEPPSS